jgi:hypothetical protein
VTIALNASSVSVDITYLTRMPAPQHLRSAWFALPTPLIWLAPPLISLMVEQSAKSVVLVLVTVSDAQEMALCAYNVIRLSNYTPAPITVFLIVALSVIRPINILQQV